MKSLLRIGLSCLFLLQLNVIGFAQSEIITTVAGSSLIGDGGFATAAEMDYPCGVAVDTSGNLYIAGYWNNLIRKVTPGGIISTVAGNGTPGYSGDGGPATSASLSWPRGMALDSSGNLYIADNGNNRIRKVSKPSVSFNLDLSAGGAGQSSTIGGNPDTQPGYDAVAVKSGAVPYGTAVFSFKQNGVNRE
jgi:hypothetical protein